MLRTPASFVVGGAGVALLLTAGPAAAQAPSVEEVVVTARKIEENIQTVPVAITAFSGENLRQQSVRTFADIQGQTPNLYLQKATSEPQSLTLSLRGQKQNDIVMTVDPSVGVYVDGFYYPRSLGLRAALIDIARVEVLRGPQGTLYGRNTTGGAMSIYTQDPTEVWGGSMELQGGNYEAVNVIGVLNMPVTEGLAIRLAGQYGSHDGYGEDGLGKDLAQEKGGYLRAKVKADLGEHVTAVLSASYQHNIAGGTILKLSGLRPGAIPGQPSTTEVAVESGLPLTPAGLTTAAAIFSSFVGGDPYRNAGTSPNYSKFNESTLGLDLTVRLPGDLTLRSLTGYADLHGLRRLDGDGTPFTLIDVFRDTSDKYYSQELQLLGGDDRFNWVAGGYISYEDGSEYEEATTLARINPAAPNISDADVRNQSIAGFGQANWEFAPTWRLTVGYRYSEDVRKLVTRNRNRLGCTVPAGALTNTPGNPLNGPALCPRIFKDKFGDSSWLISLDHAFNDDAMGYVKVSRGYRTGGLNYRGNTRLEAFAPFDPETVTEYEGGLKADLLERRLRLNAAVFYDDYKNIQRSSSVTSPSGPVTLVTNAASGSVKGFEVEAAAFPTAGLTIRAATGYTDGEYKTFNDAVLGDRSNEDFGVPKWTAMGSVRYATPTPWGEASLQLDYHWQSRTILFPGTPSLDQVTQGSYGLLNGRIALAFEEWDGEIAVFGKNLTDEEYSEAAVTIENSLGFNYVITGEPRIYGIQLLKRFGGR